jgi:hypothetical protein
MKYLIVLDSQYGTVNVYPYNPDEINDVKQIIIYNGHNIDDVQYLCTDELLLQIHSPL